VGNAPLTPKTTEKEGEKKGKKKRPFYHCYFYFLSRRRKKKKRGRKRGGKIKEPSNPYSFFWISRYGVFLGGGKGERKKSAVPNLIFLPVLSFQERKGKKADLPRIEVPKNLHASSSRVLKKGGKKGEKKRGEGGEGGHLPGFVLTPMAHGYCGIARERWKKRRKKEGKGADPSG